MEGLVDAMKAEGINGSKQARIVPEFSIEDTLATIRHAMQLQEEGRSNGDMASRLKADLRWILP